MKTLLVGFKKYAGHPNNPSERTLERFLGKSNVMTVLLEPNYDKAKKILEKAIVIDKPDLILVLNLFPYHGTPALEQYAYNQMDSLQPDESGVMKTREAIYPNEPASLSTSFDLSRFNQILKSQEIESYTSVDGGRFFDNEAYYIALRSGVPSIMIHLPFEERYSIDEDVALVTSLIDLASKNIAVK